MAKDIKVPTKADQVKSAEFSYVQGNEFPSFKVNDIDLTYNGSGKYMLGKEALEGEALRAALGKAAKPTEEGIAEALHFDQLHKLATKMAPQFKSTGTPMPLQHVLDAEPFRTAYASKNAEKLADHLVETSDLEAHLKYVPKEEVAGFRRDMIAKATALDAEKGPEAYANYMASIKRSRALAKDVNAIDFAHADYDFTGKAKAKLDELLAQHYTTPEEFAELQKRGLPKEVADKLLASTDAIDFKTHAKGFANTVDELKGKLTEVSEDITSANTKLGGNKKKYFPSTKVEKEAGDALKKAELKGTEVISDNTAHAGVAMKNLPKDVQENLNSLGSIKTAGSKASSGVGSAVTKDAAKTKFDLFGIFKQDQKFIDKKLSENAGKTEEQLELAVGKWHKGRVIAGIAAVGAAVLACTAMMGGNKEEKSFAEREDMRRAAAVAAAQGASPTPA